MTMDRCAEVTLQPVHLGLTVRLDIHVDTITNGQPYPSPLKMAKMIQDFLNTIKIEDFKETT